MRIGGAVLGISFAIAGVLLAQAPQAPEKNAEKLYAVCMYKFTKGVALYEEPSLQHIRKKLKCSEEVTQLGPDDERATKVRTKDGTEGYVLSQLLSPEKAATARLREAERQAKLRDEEEARQPPRLSFSAPPERVKAALAGYYLQNGWQIGSDTPYQVSFWSDLTGAAGVVTQALLGNAYSDTPRQVITFLLAPTAEGTTVTAAMEVSVRMALGNTNRVSTTTNKNYRPGVQSVLAYLKPSVENQQSTSSALPALTQASAANAEATTVEVTSIPAGADIELDGAFVGNTPSVLKVKEGDHVVLITKSGYVAFKRNFRTSGGSIRISAELAKGSQ